MTIVPFSRVSSFKTVTVKRKCTSVITGIRKVTEVFASHAQRDEQRCRMQRTKASKGWMETLTTLNMVGDGWV